MVHPNFHQSLKLIAIVAFVALGGSCARSGTVEFAPVAKQPEVTVNDLDIDYFMIQKEVIAPSCIGCHSATAETPTKPFFDTYEQVRDRTERILHRISNTPGRPMPPTASRYPRPDGSRVRLISRWRELDYPEDRTRPKPEPEPEPKPEPQPEPTPEPEPEPQVVDYPMVVARVLKPNGCLECHSGKDPYDPVLGDYKAVKQFAKEIYEQISTKSMPPQCADDNSCVKDEDVKLFKNWIDQSFPEGTTTTETTTVTYPMVRSSLLEASCLGCHGGAEPIFEPALNTYAEAKNYSKKILERISSTDPTQVMPPECTTDNSCVKEDVIQLVKNWIDQGTLEAK